MVCKISRKACMPYMRYRHVLADICLEYMFSLLQDFEKSADTVTPRSCWYTPKMCLFYGSYGFETDMRIPSCHIQENAAFSSDRLIHM